MQSNAKENVRLNAYIAIFLLASLILEAQRDVHSNAHPTLNIENLNQLPDVASRAGWAAEIEVNQTTLWRAENKGQLKGTRTKSGGVIHTKAQILEWLGLLEPTK